VNADPNRYQSINHLRETYVASKERWYLQFPGIEKISKQNLIRLSLTLMVQSKHIWDLWSQYNECRHYDIVKTDVNCNCNNSKLACIS